MFFDNPPDIYAGRDEIAPDSRAEVLLRGQRGRLSTPGSHTVGIPSYMHVPAPPDGVGQQVGPGQQLIGYGQRSLAQYSPYIAQLMERNGMGAARMPHTHERMIRMIQNGQPFVSADRLRQFAQNPQAMQALCNNLQRYLQQNPNAPDSDRIRATVATLGQISSSGQISANQIEALSRTEVGAYAAAVDIQRNFGRTNQLDRVEAAAAQENAQTGFRLASADMTRPTQLGPEPPDPRYQSVPRAEAIT